VNLLASKVDALARHFDKVGAPFTGSSSSVMYEVGASVRSIAFKSMLLLNVMPLFKELSMSMLCKTSTHAHKTTYTSQYRPPNNPPP